MSRPKSRWQRAAEVLAFAVIQDAIRELKYGAAASRDERVRSVAETVRFYADDRLYADETQQIVAALWGAMEIYEQISPEWRGLTERVRAELEVLREERRTARAAAPAKRVSA